VEDHATLQHALLSRCVPVTMTCTVLVAEILGKSHAVFDANPCGVAPNAFAGLESVHVAGGPVVHKASKTRRLTLFCAPRVRTVASVGVVAHCPSVPVSDHVSCDVVQACNVVDPGGIEIINEKPAVHLRAFVNTAPPIIGNATKRVLSALTDAEMRAASRAATGRRVPKTVLRVPLHFLGSPENQVGVGYAEFCNVIVLLLRVVAQIRMVEAFASDQAFFEDRTPAARIVGVARVGGVVRDRAVLGALRRRTHLTSSNSRSFTKAFDSNAVAPNPRNDLGCRKWVYPVYSFAPFPVFSEHASSEDGEREPEKENWHGSRLNKVQKL